MINAAPSRVSADTQTKGLLATTGREAVSWVETSVCGDAAVSEPAVAEGLALGGRLTAALPSAAPLSDPTEVPFVVHRIARVASGWGAFELWPTTVQEAVDGCLVARRLATQLRSPGVCAQSPELAESVELCRLPSAAQLQQAIDVESSATAAGPLSAALEAFEKVAAALDRPCAPMTQREVSDAEVVVVGVGAGMAKVYAAVDLLRKRGARVGALSLHLLRPFPRALLDEALEGRRVLLAGDEASRSLSDRIDSSTRLDTSLDCSQSLGELVTALAAHLPGTDSSPPAGVDEAPRVVGAPEGPWGEPLLREAAALLGRLAPVRLSRGLRVRGAVSLACAPLASEGAVPPGLDALVSPDPAWLDPAGLLGVGREAGTVVTNAACDGSAQLWWQLLSESQRALITRRRLRVSWVDAAGLAREAKHPGLARWALLGALLGQEDGLAGDAKDVIARLSETLNAEGRAPEADLLQRGAEGAQLLDPVALKTERPAEEIDFRAQNRLPQLPKATPAEGKAGAWRARIQRFHATGEGPPNDLPGGPLRPALLTALLDSERTPPFPLVLVEVADAEGGDTSGLCVTPLRALLTSICQGLTESGLLGGRALPDNLLRFELRVGARLAGFEHSLDLREACQAAAANVALALGLPAEDDAVLRADLAKLIEALPAGRLLGLAKHTPLAITLAALEAARAPSLFAFQDELRSLAIRLDELLLLDRQGSTEGRAPGALARALGGSLSLVDADALASRLERVPTLSPLEPERRARVAAALAEINGYLEDPPSWVLVHASGISARVFGAVGEGPKRHEHADPCGVARGLWSSQAQRLERLLRAVRVGRLELEGQYVPGLHDEPLKQFDWESFTALELSLVPPVVVVTQAPDLNGTGLASFLGLLRSRCPVRVLVLLDSGGRDDVRAHDLAYQAIGQREAAVLQSSLARPVELVRGLSTLASSTRPAVAFVEQPRWIGAAWPELWASALAEGREVPGLCYDPCGGETWAERFELIAPQSDRTWPVYALRYTAEGEEREEERAFSFAHLAALVPAFRRHLWIVPPEAWADDQVPIAEFLDDFDPGRGGPPQAIPYLWVTDEKHQLQRAVISRELAFACRERARLWRVLQELGGLRNEHAMRAAKAAHQAALAEADASRAELTAAHQAELEELKQTATQEAVDYLVGALLNPGSVAFAPAAASAPAAPAPTAEATVSEPEAAPAAAVEEEDDALSFDEAFIDSPLCTTCNECTNLNSRMFQYNADKQATIADVSAGTFLELVQAAEKCPARCIHPGKPRSGDDTVTDELIERAAPFN